MFSFGRRKKRTDVQSILRRAIDVSTPNLLPPEAESRWDTRANRTFPVVLAPWRDCAVEASEATTALSKNVSGQGLTVILSTPLEAEQLVVSFWLESQVHFFLGSVRHCTSLGGGYWQLGMELACLLNPADHPSLDQLLPLADELIPC